MTISTAFIAGLLLTLGQSDQRDPRLPTKLDVEPIRSLQVQHDGRWPPLDTLARDVVESVTGDPFFGDVDPVITLLAWTFDAQTWADQPLISISNAELRRELKLSPTRTRFSYGELTRQKHLHELVSEAANIEEGKKPNPLQAKVRDIEDKLISIQNVLANRVIRPIPDPDDANGRWRTVMPPTAGKTPQPVWDAWSELRTTFLADDSAGFVKATERLKHAVAQLPAAHRSSAGAVYTELTYNKLRPFRTAWMVSAVAAGLAVIALPLKRRWFDVITLLVLATAFGICTWGLGLRWQIAGRVPASNMYESLLFLGWGMGLFAIVSLPIFRNRLVLVTTSVMGALSLMLADILPVDSYIRPIAPVLLDTFWMSVHVPVIMVSYSVLAIGVFIAHLQIIVLALGPRGGQLSTRLDGLHYWYIHVGSILLLAGIVTGSMWAASSWGRYWGWDPKEVWSLVALLGYLTILHVRIDRRRISRTAYVLGAAVTVGMFAMVVPLILDVSGESIALTAGKLLAFAVTLVAMAVLLLTRGRFATAVKSIMCFWLIIMTYVGVNYVLGIGLHSYGFGTGAVVRYMFGIGGADLALVLLFSAIYLYRCGYFRRNAITSSEATPSPMPS